MLQTFPSDVVERLHHQFHFSKDFARVHVVPVQSKAIGQLDGDGPIGSCFTRRRNGGAAHLHLAVGICNGACFLCPCGGGQDYVSVIRGFRQEDVLHDEVVKLGQRIAGMFYVRV